MDDLTRASRSLRNARARLADAMTQAQSAAVDASAAGTSEVTIATRLDVHRQTVRSWLGKPRKR